MNLWPLWSRLGGVAFMALTGGIMYERLTTMVGHNANPDDAQGHVLAAIATFLLLGIPSLYTCFHGIRFGPDASAARTRGWGVLFGGLGAALLGAIGMGLMFMCALPFGVLFFQWGLLLPLVPATAGLVNIVTGVDVAATLGDKFVDNDEDEE